MSDPNGMKKKIIIVMSLLSLIACEKATIQPDTIDPNKIISYSTDIQLIFNKNSCTDCHNGGLNPDLRSGKSYESLTSGGYVTTDTSKASTCRLYQVLQTSHKARVTNTERQTIFQWLKQGAKDN